jgi:hypothetical protein
MRLMRIVLCFPDGDKIIVENEESLVKFNLDAVKTFEVQVSTSREEFEKLRESFHE